MSNEKHIPVKELQETTHLSSEQLKSHHEQLEASRSERAEKATSNNEHEKQRAEQLANAEARSSEEITSALSEKPQTEARRLNKEDKEHAFATTMHHVRQNLSKPERSFSKFIHQPAGGGR